MDLPIVGTGIPTFPTARRAGACGEWFPVRQHDTDGATPAARAAAETLSRTAA
jgi:hypothetical protein